MKSRIFLLLLSAFFFSPLRVNAWFEDTENRATAETPAEETRNNSQAGRVEAAQNEAGEGKRNPRDGSETVALPDDNSAAATSSAATEQDDHSSSDPQTKEKSASSADSENISEDFLVQQKEAAQEAMEQLRQEHESIQNDLTSGRKFTAHRIKNLKEGTQRDRDEWQEISQRYGIFLQAKKRSATSFSNDTKEQILALIFAADQASQAAQEILDLLDQGTTLRSSSAGSVAAARALWQNREVSAKAAADKRSFASSQMALEANLQHHLKESSAASAASFQELLGLPRDEKGIFIHETERDNLFQKILRTLKTYDEKFQSWVAKNRGLKVASIEEAFNAITAHIIGALDFGTAEHGAVFWTGYDKKNIRNQDTAMAYAEDQNKKTIEMTRDGKILDQLGMYGPESPIATGPASARKSKVGDALFAAASKKFAEGARGNVIAVIYKPETEEKKAAFEHSTYHLIEQPILLKNQKENLVFLKELFVPPEATLPLLKKIDLLQQELNSYKEKAAEIAQREATLAAEQAALDLRSESSAALTQEREHLAEQQKALEADKIKLAKERTLLDQKWEEVEKYKVKEIEIAHREESLAKEKEALKIASAASAASAASGLSLNSEEASLAEREAALEADKKRLLEEQEKTLTQIEKITSYEQAAQQAREKSDAAKQAAQDAEKRGDKKAAELRSEIASALGGNEFNPGAAYAYSQAAEEQAQGHTQAAEFYRKSGAAYEAVASALERDNEEAAKLHSQIASILGGTGDNPGAAAVYKQAAKKEAEGHTQAAEFYRKSGAAYEAVASALKRGDEKAAKLHSQIASSLGGTWEYFGAAIAYSQAAYKQAEGNTQAAEAWSKSGEAYEAEAAALERGDEKAVELYNKIASALGIDGAAHAYARAAKEQAEGHAQVAERWRKKAQWHEAQAAALEQQLAALKK